MKKILVLLILFTLIITGCGKKEESDDTNKNAKNESLLSYAEIMAGSAMLAYQDLQVDHKLNSATEAVCFSLDWLIANDYVNKDYFEGYTGSVLASYSKERYKYTYWISDGSIGIENTEYDTKDAVGKEMGKASVDCGGAKAVKCTASGDGKGTCK